MYNTYSIYVTYVYRVCVYIFLYKWDSELIHIVLSTLIFSLRDLSIFVHIQKHLILLQSIPLCTCTRLLMYITNDGIITILIHTQFQCLYIRGIIPRNNIAILKVMSILKYGRCCISTKGTIMISFWPIASGSVHFSMPSPSPDIIKLLILL